MADRVLAVLGTTSCTNSPRSTQYAHLFSTVILHEGTSNTFYHLWNRKNEHPVTFSEKSVCDIENRETASKRLYIRHLKLRELLFHDISTDTFQKEIENQFEIHSPLCQIDRNGVQSDHTERKGLRSYIAQQQCLTSRRCVPRH